MNEESFLETDRVFNSVNCGVRGIFFAKKTEADFPVQMFFLVGHHQTPDRGVLSPIPI